MIIICQLPDKAALQLRRQTDASSTSFWLFMQNNTCSSAITELSNSGGCVDAGVWPWGRGRASGRLCPLCLREGNNLVQCKKPGCTKWKSFESGLVALVHWWWGTWAMYLWLMPGVPSCLAVMSQEHLLVKQVHPLLPLDFQSGTHPQGCLLTGLGALPTTHTSEAKISRHHVELVDYEYSHCHSRITDVWAMLHQQKYTVLQLLCWNSLTGCSTSSSWSEWDQAGKRVQGLLTWQERLQKTVSNMRHPHGYKEELL